MKTKQLGGFMFLALSLFIPTLVLGASGNTSNATHYEAKDLGGKQPGDAATATVNPPGKVTSGRVQENGGWPWAGGPQTFNSKIPDEYAGTHASEFRGTYGEGTGPGKPPTWEMDVDAYVLKVTITAPDSTPTLVCVNKPLHLACETSPSSGGNFYWEKLIGPGTVSFSPNATAQNPDFTADKPGRYVVKVTYTKGGAKCSDVSGEIIVWMLDFQEDKTTHESIEGYLPDGTEIDADAASLFGTGHRRAVIAPNSAIVVGCGMTASGATFAKTFGRGSRLHPSAEKRYVIYIDIGDASSKLRVTSTWTSSVSLTPGGIHPIITGGGSTLHMLGSDSMRKVIFSNPKQPITTTTGGNPLVFFDQVSGRKRLGHIEAGTGYTDWGALRSIQMSIIGSIFNVSL